ncbi:YbaN family protein [Echinimonas agarilytica]|uniref:Inner membrane protein n=1 Tax=Echinimonas agarilytica TaxID=1215918 RepID=A0AA41W7M5_9GAMM|nr:YbaN family protein [Echinimonas agarilytica]MCM2680053.1 YbaN family protein [Echinimonas agarilytica]
MTIKQYLMHALALICIGLGILGAFLPLLPTTPFILAAATLSAKASPRLHHWLMHHPVFGQSLRDYQQHRAVSPKTFNRAMLVLWPTIALSAYWVPLWWVAALLMGIASCVSVFLWRARQRYARIGV